MASLGLLIIPTISKILSILSLFINFNMPLIILFATKGPSNVREEYNWTKLVYEATYNFQPIVGHTYHLYEKKDKSLWLSLIGPDEWNQPYVGSFKLQTDGTWEKI